MAKQGRPDSEEELSSSVLEITVHMRKEGLIHPLTNWKNRPFQDQSVSEEGKAEMQLLFWDTNRKPDVDAAIAADSGTDSSSWFKEKRWAAWKASLCSWQDLQLTAAHHELLTPVTTLLTNTRDIWLTVDGRGPQSQHISESFFHGLKLVFATNSKSSLDVAAVATT